MYQQTISDFLAGFETARALSVLIFIIGGLCIVATAFIVSTTMVNRIIKTDREKEMMNEQVIEAGKLASVGELAAGIAHEINNPVAIMVEEAGWMEDLLEEEELAETKNVEEFRASLLQIRNQGKRCKNITHKLLSFARKTDPEARDIDVNESLEEVINLSRQRAKYGNVEIRMNLTPGLPKIKVSPSEFQQVLLNLINNALDAMDGKGGRLELTTRLDGRFVAVDVSDTGHGIPKADLSRIFNPFYTTKPVGKGTGLGLSICFGIINKVGGEIKVSSAVGVGTTFHIMVPLSVRLEEEADSAS